MMQIKQCFREQLYGRRFPWYYEECIITLFRPVEDILQTLLVLMLHSRSIPFCSNACTTSASPGTHPCPTFGPHFQSRALSVYSIPQPYFRCFLSSRRRVLNRKLSMMHDAWYMVHGALRSRVLLAPYSQHVHSPGQPKP